MLSKQKNFYLKIVSVLILVFLVVSFMPKTKIFADEVDKSKLSQYSLLDEMTIPNVNQGEFSLCWAFAASRSVETFVYKQFKDVIDISESWVSLAYYHYVNDSTNTLNDTDYLEYEYGGAGHYINYQNTINKYGVVSEGDLAYLSSKPTNTEALYQNTVEKADKNLIKNLQFNRCENMKNAGTEKSDAEIIEYMKEYLVQYGSIYGQIKSDVKTFFGKNYICSTSKDVDHAISIIGWDDNEYYQGHTGAFLAINSYDDVQRLIYIFYEDVNILENAVYIKSITYNDKSINLNYDYIEFEKRLILFIVAGTAFTVIVIPPSILFSIGKNRMYKL